MAAHQYDDDDYDMPPTRSVRPGVTSIGTGHAFQYGPDPTAGVRLFQSDPKHPTSILHVMWLNPATAEQEYQGRLPPDATHEVLITAYKKAGKYYLTPMSANGETLASPEVISIANDNPVLIAAKTEVANGIMSSHMPTMSNDAVRILEEALNAQRAETAALRAEMAAERGALLKQQEALAEQRLALSVNNTADMTQLQTSMIERHHAQSTSMVTTLTIMAENAAKRDAERHNQAMDRMEAERKYREQDHALQLRVMEVDSKIRIAEEKAKAERERADLDARSKSAEREHTERMARERQEASARLERERADADRREAENEARAARMNKPIAKQIAEWAPMLALVGLDIPTIAKSVMGGGGTQTIAELIAGTIGEGVKGYVEIRKAELQLQVERGDEDEEETYTMTLPDGQTVQLTKAQVEQLQKAQQHLAATGQPAPGDHPQLPAPVQDYTEAQYAAMSNQPLPPPVVPGKEHLQGSMPGVPASVSHALAPTEREKAVAALSVQVQKRARFTMRELLGDLESTPEAGWGPLFISTVVEVPETIDYIRVRSIYDAAIEAGATPALAERFIHYADSSGLVGADIPRR